MNICYVSDVGDKISGGHQSLLNLIIEEKKRGINPYLVSHKNWEILDKASNINIKIGVIPSKLMIVNVNDSNIISKIKYPLKLIYNKIYLKKAIKFIEENNIELIHLNSLLSSPTMAYAALKCNVPFIWHIREFMEEDHKQTFINKKQMFSIVQKANNVIAISSAVQRKYEKVLDKKLDLVYNGLPINNELVINKPRFENIKINILLVGRIVEGKRQLDAVKAIEFLYKEKGIDNIHLNIVGYRGIGSYEKQLKQYIEENKLAQIISIRDFTYDLKEIRINNDIGLICSSSEAFGRVTIENMLSGMLLIGANSGGTPELVENNVSGLLYESENYLDLADKIEYAIMNKDKMKRIIECGRESAIINFSMEKTADNVFKIYKSLIK